MGFFITVSNAPIPSLVRGPGCSAYNLQGRFKNDDAFIAKLNKISLVLYKSQAWY